MAEDGRDPASADFARGDKFPMQRGAVSSGVSVAVVDAGPAPGMTMGEAGGDTAAADFARDDKFPMQRACEPLSDFVAVAHRTAARRRRLGGIGVGGTGLTA
jgi:hypothetical protein